MSSALLVIDAQRNMFEPPPGAHASPALLLRLVRLIKRARRAGTPIVFVRNTGRAGDPDEPGTVGWELHPGLGVRPEDVLVDKGTGDAFPGRIVSGIRGTLDAWLRARRVRRVVVCGLQSESCITDTVQGALDRGYRVVLVADAHSTFDAEGAPAKATIAATNAAFAGRPGALVAPTSAIKF